MKIYVYIYHLGLWEEGLNQNGKSEVIKEKMDQFTHPKF